ncbi:MAG TPA: hypothetical protein VEF90_01945 [Xanthobacteraceae bacterium]|nr:hypothetical protein [Xanthobacteraceae bacterium]
MSDEFWAKEDTEADATLTASAAQLIAINLFMAHFLQNRRGERRFRSPASVVIKTVQQTSRVDPNQASTQIKISTI